MKFVKLLSFGIIMVAITLSVSAQQKTPGGSSTKGLGQFSSLLGRWETSGQTSVVMENWTRDSSGALHGENYVIREKDSTLVQKNKIESVGSDIFYTADFVTRNQQSRYKFSKRDSSGIYFENVKSEEYPKTICYKPVRTDSLYTWLSGPTKGAIQRQGYRFQRVN